MELMGWTVMLLGNLLLSGSLGMDILDYVSNGILDAVRQFSAISVFISLAFTVFASLCIVISLYSVNNKFSLAGIPLDIEGGYRDEINQARNYFVAVFALIFAIALNVYFSPRQITENVLAIINYITDTKHNPLLNGLYSAVGVVMLVLWIAMYYIFSKQDQNGVSIGELSDTSSKMFSRDFYGLSVMGHGLLFLEFISQIVWLFGKDNLNSFSPVAAVISTGVISFFMSATAFVFAILLFYDYTQLPNANVYNDAYFNRVFILFILSTFIFFSLKIANSPYFKESFIVMFRYLAPLAILGMSSYLVYLGKNIVSLHTHYVMA